MPYYIGTDIIEIERIRRAIGRFGSRFLDRIYTGAELRAYGHRPQTLAASFASKEAVMKLLGTGRVGTAYREIETLYRKGSRPRIILHGRAASRAKKLGITEIQVSLSHCRESAIATVIGEIKP